MEAGVDPFDVDLRSLSPGIPEGEKTVYIWRKTSLGYKQTKTEQFFISFSRSLLDFLPNNDKAMHRLSRKKTMNMDRVVRRWYSLEHWSFFCISLRYRSVLPMPNFGTPLFKPSINRQALQTGIDEQYEQRSQTRWTGIFADCLTSNCSPLWIISMMDDGLNRSRSLIYVRILPR